MTGNDCNGPLCPSSKFDESQSSTWKPSGQSVEFKYGTGDVSGHGGTETVELAGISVDNVGIAIVDRIDVQAVTDPTSGIMGMAFESLAKLGKPWWQLVYESGKVSGQFFAYWLKRNNDNGQVFDSNGGEFSIGELDHDYYKGDINYIPLSGEDYWRIPLQSISVSGQDVGLGGQGAIDTGTSLIGARSDFTSRFYSHIPGAHPHSNWSLRLKGFYEFDCSTQVDVAFNFGGKSYNINSADFALKGFTSDSSSCTGAIFSLDLGWGSPVDYVVGDAFLKNVYSVFDYGRRSVGFAEVVQ